MNSPAHRYVHGAGGFFLKEADPHLTELAAAIQGIKPVIYTQYHQREKKNLEKMSRRFGFKMVTVEKMPGGMVLSGRGTALIGRRIRDLRRAERLLLKDTTILEWGRLLGYPDCCTLFYSKHRREAKNAFAKKESYEPDAIRWAYAATKVQGPFSFFLNNMFNLFSRASFVSRESDKWNTIALETFNPGLQISALHVIPWHPCSYACRPSLRLGQRIFNFLEERLPSYAAKLKDYLTQPVLFWSKYQFAVLKEARYMGAGRFSFQGLRPPYSLLPAPDLLKLSKGGEGWIKGTSVYIKSGPGRRTALSLKNALLLDFSRQEG